MKKSLIGLAAFTLAAVAAAGGTTPVQPARSAFELPPTQPPHLAFELPPTQPPHFV